jgi:hypothetical protein
MKIGILNGGGDCAGLNAVTRAVVRMGEKFGYSIIGIRHGWAGLVDLDVIPLKWSDVSHIINQGGTILHTTRTNPCIQALLCSIGVWQANIEVLGSVLVEGLGFAEFCTLILAFGIRNSKESVRDLESSTCINQV